MSLSTELARALPRVPHPVLLKKKSALEIEADKAACAYGGVVREVPPARDVIAGVERALGPDGRNVHLLRRAELKIIPYLIWGPNPRWRNDLGFVNAYLAAVTAKWPTGVRRLWRHYALNFDPDSLVTIACAEWLAEHK